MELSELRNRGLGCAQLHSQFGVCKGVSGFRVLGFKVRFWVLGFRVSGLNWSLGCASLPC